MIIHLTSIFLIVNVEQKQAIKLGRKKSQLDVYCNMFIFIVKSIKWNINNNKVTVNRSSKPIVTTMNNIKG